CRWNGEIYLKLTLSVFLFERRAIPKTVLPIDFIDSLLLHRSN
ncbi:hypothetical protein PgNI_10726, partial [Pyricularia grisea]|uniref:Uncharacterized protein n=1 Tax=Pyricularia grisea TaxID=148305 RepID=A0A6P8AX80_PYRGI